MERLSDSRYKWLALGAAIIALEAFPRQSESLTHGVRRALGTKMGKVAVPAVIAYTTAHFYDLIPHEPRELDAYYLVARVIPNMRSNTNERWVQSGYDSSE